MISDFIFVQKKAFINTFKKIKYIPILTLHLLAYNILYYLATILISRILGASYFVGSFLAYIVKVFITSASLYVLARIVLSNNLKLLEIKDFLDNGKKYLSPLFTAFFTYYIIELLISLVTSPNSGLIGNLIITFLLYITFSAVLESIYISEKFSYDSINEGINFIVNNFINWVFPNTLIFLFLFFLFNQILIFPYLLVNLGIVYNFKIFNLLANYKIMPVIILFILSFLLVYKESFIKY